MGVLNGFNEIRLRKVGALCQNPTCQWFVDREGVSFLGVLPLTAIKPWLLNKAGFLSWIGKGAFEDILDQYVFERSFGRRRRE